MLEYFMQHIFELFPVVLAAVSVLLCGLRYHSECNRRVKTIMIFGGAASGLLIFAQTSWWASFVLEDSLVGTVFADYVWTGFNTLVMVNFIYNAVSKHDS